jgi:hypothetical protein
MKSSHKNVFVLLAIIGALAVFAFLATFSHEIPRRKISERGVDYSKCMDVSYGVYKGRACRGMTKQEVVEIIGLPETVKRTATHEQWVYGDKLLYFDNNQLVEFLD